MIPLQLGGSYEEDVEAVAFGGDGIARVDGFVVFVPLAIPGDRVRFKITEVKKSFARAALQEIIQPSSHRIKPPCPIYFDCGGCQLQEMDYQASVHEKSKILEGILKHGLRLEKVPIESPLPSPLPYAYRNKMQLAVGKNSSPNVALGLYRPNSHVITDMPSCPIQEEANNHFIPLFREGMKLSGWSPYEEKTHSGEIRHFLSRVNRNGESYVVIISTQRRLPNLEKFLNLVRHSTPLLQGLAVNVNSKQTNTVLGRETEVVWGKDYLEEAVGSYRYRYGPTVFFQVNTSILASLVNMITQWGNLHPDDSVLDLYCGVGTFTIPFAKKVRHAMGIEENLEAVRWARENASLNEVRNAKFLAGKTEELLSDFPQNEFQLAFLDPPRKGVEGKALEELTRLSPKRILYLSCNPPTLARDLVFLLAHGWRLTKVMAADFFPQTSHIEALALLEL